MSLIPAFELGLWNAWIFMILFLFIQNVPLALLNLIYRGAYKRSASPPVNKAKRIDSFITLIIIIAFIYSIFLPLKWETIWFYSGGFIFFIGLLVFLVASIYFAKTPLNEPITKGLYRYSRHPMYLAIVLVFIGISIASVSWFFLLLSIILIILLTILMSYEEQFLLEHYGDTYLTFMNKTPKWIGIPKSEKSD